VLAALFGLAALGAAALWLFARRGRSRQLSAQRPVARDVAKNNGWPVQVQPQFQAQYQPRFQPPAELSGRIRPPAELATGRPERRAYG
jgi:hypothetical protein